MGGDPAAAGAAGTAAAPPHRRFEYKYSFKGPHLVQSDGTVPFWAHAGSKPGKRAGGQGPLLALRLLLFTLSPLHSTGAVDPSQQPLLQDAIPSSDQIRIAPSLKSQRGSVWTKTKAAFENWEVEVTFRVTGRGRIGADGLAVWYTENQGLEGPVFGSADMWNGVGIFFDSFDNDGKKNNPAIVIIGNNGQIHYDHQNDGASQALASCQRDFRNKPYPVRAKITYYQKTLTSCSLNTLGHIPVPSLSAVMVNNGFTPDKNDYEFCAKVDNMVIPPQGHFGISAATGGLAAGVPLPLCGCTAGWGYNRGDDHDVLSFLTFQLTEPGKEPPTPDKEISEKEKEKYQEEFEHFQQELDKKKEEFQKGHPDLQGHPADEIFESVGDRELRQIFEGQNRIHLEIKQLNRQLDMILDEQRRYVSSLTEEISKRGAGIPGQHGQITQQEMDTVVNTQHEILRQVNEMKNSMSDTIRLVSGLQHPGSAGGVYESTQHFNDIKEHLHIVKRDIDHLVQRNT
ncbi:protein ERGIC-53 isoform X1 [Prionailurus iriomotensis]